MKDRIKFVFGIGLMAVGALILLASIAVNVAQNLNKNKAVSQFEEEKRLLAMSLEEQSKKANAKKDTEQGVAATPNGESSMDGGTLDEAVSDSSDSSTNSKNVAACATKYLVRIPKIDCIEPVKEGTDRNALVASLGHEIETASPGESGNCVIAGHRNYTFGKYFNRLGELEIGDTIYVDTFGETYEYSVKEIKVVEPTDLSVLDNTEEEILTLYTCTPIYIATHRLVIIAKRV
ncbi:class D sortase [Butyrivibrio sp. WCE2006]|uniref:class D sortase n=1 Tax=Butyrivibrio sp. WCE2006 TaxID=1410611 RepID=UPI0006795B3C|nr:class D sortase [Butyrivibrio sp. WCE2006]